MPPWRSEVESKMVSSILDLKLSSWIVTKQGVLHIIIINDKCWRFEENSYIYGKTIALFCKVIIFKDWFLLEL